MPNNTYKVAIFNHKGGVGKTTLTFNIAAALGKMGKRVLLVDSDPQCNLTSYLVADDVVDDLLDNSDKASGRTIWSVLKPISEATGDIKTIPLYELSERNLFLLPGDIRLSEYESDLGEFWAQCLQRKIKGFTGTTALSRFVDRISKKHKIDFVFYDSGPNIGPLNRSILLDCDYFITPVACDLFSLRALKTLGHTLIKWVQEWETIASLAPKDFPLFVGCPRFLGYIPENFKVYRKQIAAQHSSYLIKIEKEIYSQIVLPLKKQFPDLVHGKLSEFKLGEIKNYGSLAPASQTEGVPISDVTTVGTDNQRAEAKEAFDVIAKNILHLCKAGD